MIIIRLGRMRRRCPRRHSSFNDGAQPSAKPPRHPWRPLRLRSQVESVVFYLCKWQPTQAMMMRLVPPEEWSPRPNELSSNLQYPPHCPSPCPCSPAPTPPADSAPPASSLTPSRPPAATNPSPTTPYPRPMPGIRPARASAAVGACWSEGGSKCLEGRRGWGPVG